MKQPSFLFLATAALATILLSGCGGGDPAAPAAVPAGAAVAAGAGTGAATPGSVTGSIASIVGDYPVAVTKFDCSAGNQNATTKLELQANGSCKVTSSPPAPGLAGSVLLQRDILPEGRYTLRIAADGSLELLQGTASKAKVTCPANGLCSANAAGELTT